LLPKNATATYYGTAADQSIAGLTDAKHQQFLGLLPLYPAQRLKRKSRHGNHAGLVVLGGF
jgi:hypothetical protein